MARKTLLSEAEIRQFMKLANIKPLQEMGMKPLPVGKDDDRDRPHSDDADKDGMEEAYGSMMPGKDDERDEMEMDAEMDAPEGGEDMEMDMDAPEGDMEMDMGGDDMGADMDMGGGEDKEELVAQAVELIAKLAGVEADIEIGGDEEMGGDAMDDEGGDLEGPMDAPVGEPEDMGVEVDDEEMGEEDIVQEVARRVAARLIREKKQDAMANKLAERIFRRLASK
jgi:hypothetical protein